MKKLIQQSEFQVKRGGKTFSFFRPADPLEILESDLENQPEELVIPPYWAELWPSTEAALELLPERLSETSSPICELGSGLGVVATILADSKIPIIPSDYSEEACQLIAENGQRNGVALSPLCFDWTNAPFRSRFDTVIGVDILYEEQQVIPVLNFLLENLSSDGSAYIFDPQRYFWGKFKEKCLENGFNIEESQLYTTSEMVEVEMIKLRFK